MHITPVLTLNYNSGPAFHSNTRVVRDMQGKILYRNTTNFFRDDLDWKKFLDFIKEKYKNTPKVNVICHACSDGSEPMSLVMLLREHLPEEYKKFIPVLAKDIDKTVIYRAQEDYVTLFYPDVRLIDRFTNGKYNKYFSPYKAIFDDNTLQVIVNKDLKKDIKFSVADIKDDIASMPSENTIVFCRNFWPYILPENNRKKLAEQLAQKLKTNCIVVIGNFDRSVGVERFLQSAGFKSVNGLCNVFEGVYKG